MEEILRRIVELICNDKELHDAIVRYINALAILKELEIERKKRKVNLK